MDDIKFTCFSPVMSCANLIIRLAKESRRDERKSFPSLYTSATVEARMLLAQRTAENFVP